MTRDQVERLAQIVGPHSASAKALQKADEIGPSARFFRDGAYIVVGEGEFLAAGCEAIVAAEDATT